MSENNLYIASYAALMAKESAQKTALTVQLKIDWEQGRLNRDDLKPVAAITTPGQPEHLQLVHPNNVKKRSLHTSDGRVALAHAITHIEYNAINLALDAVYRFRDMPDRYYQDWLFVAAEEARHFLMMQEYLHSLNSSYGAYPVHNGLWDSAERTAHDVLARMALVPRVLEARGLDVTPKMIEKLLSAQAKEFAECLQTIYDDEIGHVRIGNHWFNYLCQQRNLEPVACFKNMLQLYLHGNPRGPYNQEARIKAGFTQEELTALEALSLG